MKENSEPEGRTAPWRNDSFHSFRGMSGFPVSPAPLYPLQNRSFTARPAQWGPAFIAVQDDKNG